MQLQRRSYEGFHQWTVEAGLFPKDERPPEERLDPPYDLLLPPALPDYRHRALNRVRQSAVLRPHGDTLLELPFELAERQRSGEQIDFHSYEGPESALVGSDDDSGGFWQSVADGPEENQIRWSERMRASDLYAQWQRDRPKHPPAIPEAARDPDAHCECRRLLREGNRDKTCARLLLTTTADDLPERFPCLASHVLGATHAWYACDKYPPIEQLPPGHVDPRLRVWWHMGWTLAGGSASLAESRDTLAQVRGMTRAYVRDSIPPHPLLDDSDAPIGLVLDRHFDTGSVTLFGLVQIHEENSYTWLEYVGYELRIRRAVASGNRPPKATQLLDEANLLAKWYDKYAVGAIRQRRPENTGIWGSHAEVYKEVRQEVVALWRANHGRRPRNLQAEVASRLNVHVTTLQRNLRKWKIQWEAISQPPD